MKAERLAQLVNELHSLRSDQITLEGDDPSDEEEYRMYAPASGDAIQDAEGRCGRPYPQSYRVFLRLYNGWLGFWPDWSLVGVSREDNQDMYDDIQLNVDLLPDVVGEEEMNELVEKERSDPDLILLTNHMILATDFNGSFLLFDSNRTTGGDEPEIAWVQNLQHVERRWSNFEALLRAAIEDTNLELAELRQ